MICLNGIDVTFHDAKDYIIEAVYLLEQDEIIYMDVHFYLTLLAKIESNLPYFLSLFSVISNTLCLDQWCNHCDFC